MNTAVHYHHAGMGVATSTQVESAVGSTLLQAAPYTGVAAPFVAIAGGISELLAAAGIGAGCGQTCIAATDFANQAELLLQQNLAIYQALPSPRTQSEQQSAVNNFYQLWDALISTQACGNPALGQAGAKCIADRNRGSCAYKDSKGNCWNWFIGYLDPIQNDTNVVADSPATALSSLASSTGIDPTILMIGAGVAVVLFMVSQS